MSEQKTTNAPTWDLETIFPGGSKSKEFEELRKKIAEDLEKAEKSLEGLPKNLDGDGGEKWAAWILAMQGIYERIHLSAAFSECLVCQDVTDSTAQKIDVENSEYYSKWGMLWTSLESFSKERSDEEWQGRYKSDKFFSQRNSRPGPDEDVGGTGEAGVGAGSKRIPRLEQALRQNGGRLQSRNRG